MKRENILELFKQFESICYLIEGVECWSARELQKVLGYSKWENFEKVVEKAKESCKNAGEDIADHFPDIRKTIPMPKGAEKQIDGLFEIAIFYFKFSEISVSKTKPVLNSLSIS